MSDMQIPTNTSGNGIPLSVMPDDQAIDLANRPKKLTKEEKKAQAKAQARKSEGFNTSEKLERIDKELSETQQKLETADAELNKVSVDYASGVKGSQKQVKQLRDQYRDCEDTIDALQRARQAEVDRLGKEYSDKVARAQQKLRDQIDQQTQEITKSLEKLEKDAVSLENSLTETEESMRAILGLTNNSLVGSQISRSIDSIKKVLAIRIGVSKMPTGPGDHNPPLQHMAPRTQEFQKHAEIPEYLTDLPDPDAN